MDGYTTEHFTEAAPMLSVWGRLAPTVARLIRHNPDLAGRLTLAPESTIHCIAAFLHCRADDVDVDRLAHEVATRDARDLLAEAVPCTHPRLYGLLRRVGPATRTLSFYRDLNIELGQPAAKILLEAPSISRDTISIARQLSADPVLLAARRAIGEDDIHLRHLMSVLSLLRSLGLANHIERLPSGSGIQAIFRRVKMDLRSGKPPAVSFEIPVGWQQVKDVGQLIVIGELLQNCLSIWAGDGARHVRSFLTGASAFFVHEGSPTMLASFDKLGPKTWAMREFGSTSNDENEDEERQQMIAEFQVSMARSGNTLLGTDPFVALVELYWRTRK
jgi:hypothetical protein